MLINQVFLSLKFRFKQSLFLQNKLFRESFILKKTSLVFEEHLYKISLVFFEHFVCFARTNLPYKFTYKVINNNFTFYF